MSEIVIPCAKRETARMAAGGSKDRPQQDGQGYVPRKGLNGSSGGRRRYDAASLEPMYRVALTRKL
jgi:hypothetical protein